MSTKILKLGLKLSIVSALVISCSDDDNNQNQGGNDNPTVTTQLFASNNTDGNITIYDLVSGGVTTLTTISTAAEGVFYDPDTDEVIQASRSSNQLNAFANISTLLADVTVTASISSTSDLSSPRDISVTDDFVIVADNADVDGDEDTADGRLFIYTRSNGELTLRNTLITEFAVWGIEMVGNDLYAVVDKTDQLAVFANFLATNTADATITATKTIAIEGIVRTHGIAFDAGTMILTDVGSAMDDSDGAFHIVTDFISKFNTVPDGGTLVIANNQIRVGGAATLMGNPVAAEFDAASNTVFIAEAANGEGRVLAFTDANAGGNLTPTINNSLSKASSLYFYSNQ